jgi:hypothetical protein
MADNLYAGASIQVYPSGEATLSTPHGDVGAFLAYVARFNPVNFHAKDDDVREWRYNHEYDNWQDRLGIDSVKVFYHYGHCGMTAGGVFLAAMGRTWDNTFLADSTRMSFGDQRLRYLFLHGCDNLQVHGGQNPARTFGAANKGARMIFGFDSLTYDVSGLGEGFFREWNKGKSFSQAWRDAALATLTNHRPSSTACGATPEEAQNRLWNERLFEGGAVSDNWYWWRWAGPAPLEINLDIPLPRSPVHLELRRRPNDARTAAFLADRFGVRAMVAEPASPNPGDYRHPDDAFAGPRLVLSPDGSFEVFLAEPDRSAAAVDPETIRAIADRAVGDLGLDVELVLHDLSMTQHAGASREGAEADVAVGEFTARYRQLYEGTPVVGGRDGHVTVTIDPGGTVCSIEDTTMAVAGASEARPGDGYDLNLGVEHALAEAVESVRAGFESCGASVTVLSDTRDVGFRIDGDSAVTVARQDIEVTTGDFTIRKIVEITL